MAPPRYPRPAILDAIRPDRHGVIEASAGTGKTFTLEHLILELLLCGHAEIDQILVVTFTEKATAELLARVRGTLVRLLDVATGRALPPEDPGERPWILDERAHRILARALERFELCTLSTIHGFCQRILTEQAFLSRRLFDEEHVDERRLFGQAFREALRTRLAVEPGLREVLAGALETGLSVVGIESLLMELHRARAELVPRFEPVRLDVALERLPDALTPEALTVELSAHKVVRRNALGAGAAYGEILRAVATYRERRDPIALLGRLARGADTKDRNLIHTVLRRMGTTLPAGSTAAQVGDALGRIEGLLVTVRSAVASVLLPPVVEQLERRKREQGLFDFADMLALLDQGLRGPAGAPLVALLRERYRFALIDEFQDTDEVQWSIFRRLFFEAGSPSRLWVIGDPKQAIYGFRGADVHTYLEARRTIVEGGGERVSLGECFRATPPMIDALNRILEQPSLTPFFTGPIDYPEPVRPGAPDQQALSGDGSVLAPICLLEPDPGSGAPPGSRPLMTQLCQRIAREIETLLGVDGPRVGRTGALRALSPGDIFVLTRSQAEGDDMGRALRAAGIPHAFYKQEGLFSRPEATHVLDLLEAIDEPDRPEARFRALLTPFFAVPLESLSAYAELGPGHPVLTRLDAWSLLGKERRYEALFRAILDDSGLCRRELLLKDGERELTNYLHIFELLLEEASRCRPSLPELCLLLAAFVEGRARPTGVDADVQRLESERQAVQIMTLHKAKGLEAHVVFLHGGLRGFNTTVWLGHQDGRRVVTLGGRRSVPAAIARESDEEDQRLLYVGITRARSRLYLPLFNGGLGSSLSGCYGALNRRLQAVLAENRPADAELFARERFGVRSSLTQGDQPPTPTVDLSDWRPRAGAIPTIDPTPHYSALERAHRGFQVTSYSRLQAALESRLLPELVASDPLVSPTLDPAGLEPAVEAPVLGPPDPDELPPGRATGNFLHAVLEHVPLESLTLAPQLEAWSALPAIEGLFRRTAIAHAIDARHLDDARRLVHGALTTPVELGRAGVIDGLHTASRSLREMEFVFPIPERDHPRLDTVLRADLDGAPRWRTGRGFITGVIDLLFEWQGRTFLADWKSNRLPAYEPSALAPVVRRHYDLQARLYTLAVVKMLDVRDEPAYEARIGGLLYCFVRGLGGPTPQSGLHFERPSWRDVVAWETQLLDPLP